MISSVLETVLRAEVARITGLGIGDQFVGAHGLIEAPENDHEEFPNTLPAC